jgi:hypothetical protein
MSDKKVKVKPKKVEVDRKELENLKRQADDFRRFARMVCEKADAFQATAKKVLEAA